MVVAPFGGTSADVGDCAGEMCNNLRKTTNVIVQSSRSRVLSPSFKKERKEKKTLIKIDYIVPTSKQLFYVKYSIIYAETPQLPCPLSRAEELVQDPFPQPELSPLSARVSSTFTPSPTLTSVPLLPAPQSPSSSSTPSTSLAK